MMLTPRRIIGTTGVLMALGAAVAVPAGAVAAAAPVTPRSCTANQLTITPGRVDGAAGTLWLPLYFTNTSTRACTGYGFPRVAYVTGPHGQQVNDQATHDSSNAPQPVVLAPGESAMAVLRMPQAGNYDEQTCRPVQVAGIRVAPPGVRATVFISQPKTACSVGGIATPGISALEPAELPAA